MPEIDGQILSLNAGEVSRLGVARIDLAKLRMACEVESNFLPHVLGPAMVRPGAGYIERIKSDLKPKFLEYYNDETTKALLVLTPLFMRVLIAGAYLTRGAVTAAVTNGNFNTDLAGWTNSDEAGAASIWSAGGYLSLTGTGANYAFRDQQITVTQPNAEHALRIVVFHGTVALKVGTVLGNASYYDVALAPGVYSLAFAPAGNFWIRLGANDAFPAFVDSINVEAAGVVELPTPWNTGDLANIFYDQSEDVIFVACKGLQQRRIEHRAPTGSADDDLRSWGIALYLADDGPFRRSNLTPTNIAPSASNGNVLLIADHPVFKPGHLGALYRLTHSSQAALATLGGANQFTANVRVAGLKANRDVAIDIGGTFTAKVTLQRSFGSPGGWVDVESYTVPTSKTFNDTLDNQIIYYRLGIKPGDYTNGSAAAALHYAGSIQTGIARITLVNNSLSANADVLRQFGDTTGTADWSEGEWSDQRGWPAAVGLHDGRLCWDAGVRFFGSVSDAFASYDDTVLGDKGPISRTIATGGRDGVRWLLSLQRLIAGTAAQEISIRASALDEPLSPIAFVARAPATRGVARIRPLRVDAVGVYVSRNAKRIFELAFDGQGGDFKSRELTRLKQEMCAAGVTSCAVQRHPDTRLWYTLGDGTCAVLTFERDDNVEAWTPALTTAGDFFDQVAVLPGIDEDEVYFGVARQIGGVTQRFIEKLAMRTECVGGTLSKNSDAHMVYQGAPTTTISVPHLKGRQVVVWADGKMLVRKAAMLTVNASSGIVTLPSLVSNAVIGVPAEPGRIKTGKLAFGTGRGSILTAQKRVDHVGLVMADVGWEGVRVGRSFATLNGLPPSYRGRPLAAGEVLADYDDVPSSFNGGWGPDERVCIEIEPGFPCTILALVVRITTHGLDGGPAGGQGMAA